MNKIAIKRTGERTWQVEADGEVLRNVTDVTMHFEVRDVVVCVSRLCVGNSLVSTTTRYINPQLTVEP